MRTRCKGGTIGVEEKLCSTEPTSMRTQKSENWNGSASDFKFIESFYRKDVRRMFDTSMKLAI